MKYRAEIDGLRALAVLPVILFHAGFEWFRGGFVGVDVFFVISGYLITTIIISEMADGKFSIINFYERRARRILPPLFLVSLLCIPFAVLWFTPNDLVKFGKSLIAVSTFSSNVLFWLESGYFETAAELKPLLHTWSLAVEEQYYVIFPLFLLLTQRLKMTTIIGLLAVTFGLSLSIAQWGSINSPSGAFYLLPARGWELLIGVFCAYYLAHTNHTFPFKIEQLLSSIGLIAIVYSVIAFDDTIPFPSLFTLIPTIGTASLIIFATPNTYAYRLLSGRLLVGVGLISYGAYLWHQPILAFLKYTQQNNVTSYMLICGVMSSLLMALLSYRYVEGPFRNKSTFTRDTIFKMSFVLMTFFCLVGIAINYTDGGLRLQSTERQSVLGHFIDAQEYVIRRHKEIRLNDFSSDNRKKIVIIGDSHSEDLVNAVFEAGLDAEFEFSSFYIPVRCGVLFVQNRPIIGRESTCGRFSFYDEELQNLIKVADQVWVISSWKESHLVFIQKSIKNLVSLNEDLVIFGTKNFGRVSELWYSNNLVEAWASKEFSQSEIDELEIKSKINKAIAEMSHEEGVKFLNPQHLICEELEYCSNFTSGGIISHDGDHLTPHGAAILGAAIRGLHQSGSL